MKQESIVGPSHPYPESVLLSLYKAYPRKTGRPVALKRITEALDRICEGEIDGQPRQQSEAIEYLRAKIDDARKQMGSREKKFIPHMATWLHQRRYLRPELHDEESVPDHLVLCIAILARYPKMPPIDYIRNNLSAFLLPLNAIGKALERNSVGGNHRGADISLQNAFRQLESRTTLYAMAVKQWPVEDLKYVPNPAKWYGEARYDQPEQSWQRQPANDYVRGREQLGRVFDELAKTGNSGGRPD